jgi:hypothetical protein
MFGFLRREQPGQAAVFFPGSAPPPADAFLRLRDRGYELAELEPRDNLWALSLAHPTLGTADLWCEREMPPLADFIQFASNLTPREKAAGNAAAASVRLQVPATRRNVLRDRKTLLRMARDVLGEDGVMVLDLASQLPWSPVSLADEMAHDADLDVEALYCLHSVFDGDEPDETNPVHWLHSHGLAELGGFDIDVVAPHPDFVPLGAESIRAIATMILNGDVAADQSRFAFAHPGGEARFVPAAEFMRTAKPQHTELRHADDHDERRSVLCEPAGRRVLGFGRGDTPEPLAIARRPPPDQFVVFFHESATKLMAERSAATVGILRSMMAEFAGFEVVTLLKLGYPTPEGRKEHLWFEAHAIGDTTADATLENTPFKVDLRPGERADRPLELLTDWMIITPAGMITPRSFIAARLLRENPDEIRREMTAGGPG